MYRSPAASNERDTTPALDWHDWAGLTPDVSQRSTLLQLAQMAFNTYAPSNTTPTSWYPLLPAWRSSPFGWEPTDDGMRGHVFVASDNKTVVIATKGTSTGWLAGDGGPTVGRDKRNDNLMFSCCCARVGPTWSTVCGCWDGGYRCDTRCVEEALVDEGLFYPIGLNLYNNVSYMYPNANIWLTGHSLGGGLSALMGATFGVPVVAFEAPGEKLASRRLHLPAPPSLDHITHVYHTADPIPMGTCTGVTSLCALGGFALETRCHTGQVVRFDTVSKLGWSVDVRTHGIGFVIEKLLGDEGVWREEDDDDEGEGDGGEGIWGDCYNWEFGEFRNSTRIKG
ncbi:Alpha/Beta hydrolase protein [Crassisporium funariophilum]|nr:Alpha/Beta hydrolase protein [Crassisporium funariophilum]